MKIDMHILIGSQGGFCAFKIYLEYSSLQFILPIIQKKNIFLKNSFQL